MPVSMLALLGAMISIQVGATLAKQLFPSVGASGATALRLTFAAVLLCLVWRPWTYRFTRPMWRVLLPYGASLGTMNLLFYLALARIPLGLAVALEFTGPLALALVLSRKATDFVWTILAIVGVLLILPSPTSTASIDLAGVVFALGAGLCWALYIVFGQRAGTLVPSGITAAVGMVVAACVAVPIASMLMPTSPLSRVSTGVLGVALIVAVMSSAIPYTLEMFALKRIPAKTFSILMSLEPAIAAFSGLIFLHERLASIQWLAIACIMIASAGSAVSARGLSAEPVT